MFYCSRECQKAGWKVHKDACRPFTVTRNKEVGRLLVASRDLAVGDVILREVPLVMGPKQDTDPLCLGCYRRLTGSYRCSRCTWPLCGPQCEASAAHQPECEVTKAAGITISLNDTGGSQSQLYELVTPLRCVVAAGRGGTAGQRWRASCERLNSPRPPHTPNASPLQQHHQLQIQQEQTQQLQQVATALRDTFRLQNYPGVDVSEAAMLHVLELLQVNQVPTKVPYAEVTALYPMASLVSHSCTPNTRPQWKEGALTLLAADPIPRGEPITALYTDILWGTRARRDHLRHTRQVTCTCRRCADPTELDTYFSALVCRRCGKDVLPSAPMEDTAPWLCRGCGQQVSVEEALRTSLALGAAVEAALASPTIEGLEALQHEWLGKVHRNHYHLHAVKHSLLQLYGRSQEKAEEGEKDAQHWREIAKKEAACKEFLTVCSRLDPSTAHTAHCVGLTFYEYHKTILQSAQRHFALNQISRQQLKKRMLLSKALLKKTMDIFRDEAPDTPEGQLCDTCEEEVIRIGKWMLAVGLV